MKANELTLSSLVTLQYTLLAKDIWRAEKLGIKPSASQSTYFLNFTRINPTWFRAIVKRFVRLRTWWSDWLWLVKDPQLFFYVRICFLQRQSSIKNFQRFFKIRWHLLSYFLLKYLIKFVKKNKKAYNYLESIKLIKILLSLL